jgi:hypothetical protein
LEFQGLLEVLDVKSMQAKELLLIDAQRGAMVNVIASKYI